MSAAFNISSSESIRNPELEIIYATRLKSNSKKFIVSQTDVKKRSMYFKALLQKPSEQKVLLFDIT